MARGSILFIHISRRKFVTLPEESMRIPLLTLLPDGYVADSAALSFLNSQAALEALPKIIDIMSKELKWTSTRQNEEFDQAKDFLMSMGLHPSLRNVTFDQVRKGKLPRGRSLGEPIQSAQLSDPGAGPKEQRRQIPVERSGGGT